jgi:hypothetical protein
MSTPIPSPPVDLGRVVAELLPAYTRADVHLWRWSRIIAIVAGLVTISFFVERHVYWTTMNVELKKVDQESGRVAQCP